jgi:hypothetical protein
MMQCPRERKSAAAATEGMQLRIAKALRWLAAERCGIKK